MKKDIKDKKFRFVRRCNGKGLGLFENLSTGELIVNKIKEDGLSLNALIHFGHLKQDSNGKITRVEI